MEDLAAFPSGLRVGDATTSGAVLSVLTAEPALTLVVMTADDLDWVEHTRRSLTPVDGVVSATLDDLDADTAYALAVYADDTRRTAVVRLRTAATEARVLRFGATSCLGDANPDLPCLGYVAADALDFFLLLGDAVYADGSTTVAEYRRYWAEVLARPTVRAALGSTSLVATWDDHEVDNNWSMQGVTDDQYAAALSTYLESLPQEGGPTGRIWRTLSWGSTAELFVLDCRSERLDGRYISAEQMAWLRDALATSTARFKIILNSVPITDLTRLFDQVEIDDRWDGHPEDRTEILTYIRDAGIAGVVWVTGDVHFGAVTRVDAPGGPGADAWEVFTGPAGSFPNPLVDYFPADEQYTWLSSAWNWVRFTCDPGLGTVQVEHIDSDGQVIHDVTLTP